MKVSPWQLAQWWGPASSWWHGLIYTQENTVISKHTRGKQQHSSNYTQQPELLPKMTSGKICQQLTAAWSCDMSPARIAFQERWAPPPWPNVNCQNKTKTVAVHGIPVEIQQKHVKLWGGKSHNGAEVMGGPSIHGHHGDKVLGCSPSPLSGALVNQWHVKLPATCLTTIGVC